MLLISRVDLVRDPNRSVFWARERPPRVVPGMSDRICHQFLRSCAAISSYSAGVERLLIAAADLWRATGAGDRLRLIGGLAVHLYVGAAARVTADIDVVCMDEQARAAVSRRLEALGYRLGVTARWIRAVDPTGQQPVVDVSSHPVVDLRRFENVALHGPPRHHDVEGINLALAAPDDLALLKLVAARDQDCVDLLVLAGAVPLSATAIARRAERDDIERSVAQGAGYLRHLLSTGALAEIAEEALGRAMTAAEPATLGGLLAQLEKEGL
ncbi:MAG: hypothetical protein HY744_11210 [Deltaproteobacteria bacterium]|nr:hypothetical protein [Deltaproteobacteria bacterium]